MLYKDKNNYNYDLGAMTVKDIGETERSGDFLSYIYVIQYAECGVSWIGEAKTAIDAVKQMHNEIQELDEIEEREEDEII